VEARYRAAGFDPQVEVDHLPASEVVIVTARKPEAPA
jgi:hypothetical protein